MIKLKKRGFSIAELLLVLAIISIISILGLKIAQRGMEKAYDTYVYTGYRSLMDAIWTANNYGKELPEAETESDGSGYKNSVSITPNGSMSPFIQSMALILTNDNLARTQISNNGVQINTINKISYLISRDMLIDSETGHRRLTITMTVPKKRTITNNNNVQDSESFEFMYYPDDDFSIPVTTGPLRRRRDLLPFYSDDGEVNRVVQEYQSDGSSNITYNGKPDDISMEQAFCEAYGVVTTHYNGQTQNIYDCTNISKKTPQVTPKLGKPNHVF